jgi:hypothetical protein
MKIKQLIILSIIPLLFTGCTSLLGPDDSAQIATNVQNRYYGHIFAVRNQLDKIKIGMKESEVTSIIGYPSEDNPSRTAAGKSEQWIYNAQILVGRIEGHNAYNDFESLTIVWHLENPRYYLNFENNVLTSTQGF